MLLTVSLLKCVVHQTSVRRVKNENEQDVVLAFIET